MRLLKILSVLVALAGLGVLAMVFAPSIFGRVDAPVLAQTRPMDWVGGRLGVSARDLDAAEADRQKLSGGAVIEDVQSDSPASRAGLKRSDIVVEFDGEHVRSARQFARLVQETAPGRSVKATVVRDGQRTDVQVTPSDDRGPDVFINGDRLKERIDGLVARMPAFDMNFDFDMQGMMGSRGRLGVTVEAISDQLGTYFGAKNGVLVTSVAAGSAAEKAGLKAGDVITSVNGTRVNSASDLTRLLRDANADADVTVGIVRDKKESSLKTRIEPRRQA